MTTVAALRDAIARCANLAAIDAPADCDRRIAIFIARLSGCMESLGDHELDAMLWGLFDQAPSAASVAPMPAMPVLGAA